MPLLSVVIPAYNAERFLAEALASVFRNGVLPLEVIVVDDGSTDGTKDAVAGLPVRYLRAEHRGVAAARNIGWRAARGELLAWLDADDRWSPGRLEKQLAALASQESSDIVYGHVQQFRSDSEGESLFGPPLPGRLPGTMLVRREAFARVGGFDEALRVGEFMDWLVRSRQHALNEVMLESVCLERRIHDSNLGIVARDRRRDYLLVARRSLAQGRLTEPKRDG